MSKRYFDVYIRPAGAHITDEDLAAGNILNSFKRLDLPEKGAKLGFSPEQTELGDGTMMTDSEQIQFDSGTHRVDVAEYNFLRSTFHNQSCDVMLFDPSDSTIVALAFGMKMAVTQLVESGASSVIKITGNRRWYEAAITLLTPTVIDDYGVVSGTVYSEAGAVLEGATVTITVGAVDYVATTDKDGKFLLCVPKGTQSIVAALTGYTFNLTDTVVVAANQEAVVTITAEHDPE